MKKNPLFSVIVPIYKIENYLVKCIESIINQTYSNIEIILVNDGSPDSCKQICEEYKQKDSRIKVINKLNGGLVSARKFGAELANGEYIACIDGDDWISNNYFEKFANIIKEYNPDVLICGCIWSYDDKEVVKPVEVKPGYYDRKSIEEKFFPMLIENCKGEYFSSSIWGKIFKKDIYIKEQLLVSDNIKIGEDQACVKPIIYNSNSIYILDENLYYYRQNPTSMTKKPSPFEWSDPKLLGRHLESRLPLDSFDFKDQIDRLVVHNLFNVASSQFYKNKSYNEIKKDINKNIKDKYYKDIIDRCKFSFATKGFFALSTLKYRITFLLYLYNKLNN